jgi:3'-5' exonuclease
MSSKYLGTEKQWGKLLDFIYRDNLPVGWDTEFEGVDFDAGNNCVGTSRIDMWSVALFTGELHPRGYEIATGYVLPPESIGFFKEFLEDASIIKPAHNSTVDVHTMYNVDVDVSGVVDTLHLCRFAFPGKFRYGLDALAKEYLDESKFMSFSDLVAVPAYVDKQVKVKKCVCGEEGCRKRKGDHTKYTEFETVQAQKGTTNIAISSIRPGHVKWDSYVQYAGQDAVLALELYDYTSKKLRKLNYENPFRFDKSV